jgi:hypothetical protein
MSSFSVARSGPLTSRGSSLLNIGIITLTTYLPMVWQKPNKIRYRKKETENCKKGKTSIQAPQEVEAGGSSTRLYLKNN